MLKRAAFVFILLAFGGFSFSQQLDSLNPSIAGNCIKTLNLSDKLFENSDFDQSYKYWQRAYGICDKEIGSGMFYLGEALLEYRLFEADSKTEQKQVLDSLVNLIETRQKYYGNEMQLKGQEPISAHKKLIALQVFYGINEHCEYLKFEKDQFSGAYLTQTFPALLWEDHYLSVAASAKKENNQIQLTFIVDQEHPFTVKKGSPCELSLNNGDKILLKASNNATATKIMKFQKFVYRARLTCYLDPTSAAIIKSGDGISKISVSGVSEKIVKPVQYPDALKGILKCLK
jgi:hypothetical protein